MHHFATQGTYNYLFPPPPPIKVYRAFGAVAPGTNTQHEWARQTPVIA